MRIALLCSGGVDSSLALYLLKKQGHELTAFYLKVWLEDEWDGLPECPWQEDLEYVEKTCNLLDVPCHVLPFQQEYQKQIIVYVIDQVKRGYTPNPDLLCNSRIKFGAFLSHLDPFYEKVASGHYAGLGYNPSVGYELLSARDPLKDQTYFLAHLNQSQLSRALFPLSNYTKAQVRSQAQSLGLPSCIRKDSQGLCFLGKIRFSEFLRSHLGEAPGELIEVESGRILGEHAGFWFYTIGQRHGLGLSEGPWYVSAKDPQNNCVYISRHYYSPEKSRDSFFAAAPHWISGKAPRQNGLRVKLRHGALSYPCSIEPLLEYNSIFVRIQGNDQGIAPGQFAVFYRENVCLGCAMISAPPPDQSLYTSSWPKYARYKSQKNDASHPA